MPVAIERLLTTYLRERVDGENFRRFCARHSEEELRTFLSGGAMESVARDPSPGRPPHGVEG